MKIGIGISYFDNNEELDILLPQIYDKVEEIILIDGKYSNFYTDHDYSKIPYTPPDEYRFVINEKFTGDEYQKRQKILDIAGEKNLDFLIMWDTDEFPHPRFNDWTTFRKQLARFSKYATDYRFRNEFNINMLMYASPEWDAASNGLATAKFHKQPRIFKDPKSIRYALQTHYRFTFKCIDDEMIIKNPTIPLCIGASYTCNAVRLLSTSKYRPPQYLEIRRNWSHDTIHEERARLYYEEMKIKGHPERIPPDEPHYFLPDGHRVAGQRPIISY
jgi:hypothetical protein